MGIPPYIKIGNFICTGIKKNRHLKTLDGNVSTEALFFQSLQKVAEFNHKYR